MNDSKFSFVTRPFFPVPMIKLISIPCFLASDLTAGVERALLVISKNVYKIILARNYII
jgi:hypothetical protein